MAGTTLAQMMYLSQELTLHLKEVHTHNAEMLAKLQKASKVLRELLDAYNKWQLERMQEECK